MPIEQNFHSNWRIDFARELAAIYSARQGVRTIVLGGSPSRGLSDEYSDLDMIVYWDEMDTDFISGTPLKEYGGEIKLLLRDPGGAIQMELYYFDTLIVEIGHTSIAEWNTLLDDVLIHNKIHPYSIKTIGGFRDAVPVYGAEVYDSMRSRVGSMPHEAAVKLVSMNLGFFWRGCILNQGIRRNEIVFYHDAFCMTIKRLVTILAGLNHHFFSPLEPRWLEYELGRMAIKPADMWRKIQSVFTETPEKSVDILETLIREVIELVDQHMPEVDMTKYRECDALEIRATTEKPVLLK